MLNLNAFGKTILASPSVYWTAESSAHWRQPDVSLSFELNLNYFLLSYLTQSSCIPRCHPFSIALTALVPLCQITTFIYLDLGSISRMTTIHRLSNWSMKIRFLDPELRPTILKASAISPSSSLPRLLVACCTTYFPVFTIRPHGRNFCSGIKRLRISLLNPK
jgi:hypothetical protein